MYIATYVPDIDGQHRYRSKMVKLWEHKRGHSNPNYTIITLSTSYRYYFSGVRTDYHATAAMNMFRALFRRMLCGMYSYHGSWHSAARYILTWEITFSPPGAINCCIEWTETPIHLLLVSDDAQGKNEDSRFRRFFFGGILKVAFWVKIPNGQESR